MSSSPSMNKVRESLQLVAVDSNDDNKTANSTLAKDLAEFLPRQVGELLDPQIDLPRIAVKSPACWKLVSGMPGE